jgi:hypothetical protein
MKTHLITISIVLFGILAWFTTASIYMETVVRDRIREMSYEKLIGFYCPEDWLYEVEEEVDGKVIEREGCLIPLD